MCWSGSSGYSHIYPQISEEQKLDSVHYKNKPKEEEQTRYGELGESLGNERRICKELGGGVWSENDKIHFICL